MKYESSWTQPGEGFLKEVELDEGIKVGDNIHLGFGAKGGTGFKGKVIKIDGNIIHIKNPEGKKYKGPMKFVTKEEVGLDEWTISDVERAMKKKYGKVDKEAIAKLKKVQHMGNVDRNALVKVGHGKLLVQSVEIDEESKYVKVARDVVKKKSAKKVDGVLLDLYTAGVIVQVYDAVNSKYKKRMDGLKLKQLSDLAFRAIFLGRPSKIGVAFKDMQKEEVEDKR